MNSSRIVTMACICSVALLSIHCDRDAQENISENSTLTIHIPELDERLLGPLGARPWFLVFLALAIGSEYSDTPEPRLLDRWEHTPDYTTWTVHVREGIHWGDGVPVTAEDVKFSLDLWTNPGIAYEYRFFEEITVLDKYHLQMSFNKPVSSTIFVYNWLAMLPKHLLEPLDPEGIFSWPFWIQPVGNGPYRYVSHIPGVMTELEANPGYYSEQPNIRKVILRFGGNSITELLSGNVDIANRINPLQAAQLAANPLFSVYYRIRYEAHVGILWNHRNPLFQDAGVRKALTLSIDRRELNQILNHPDETPIFDVPAMEHHYRQGVVPDPMPFDPERAAQLLTKAGWVDNDGDGFREKNGQEFHFTLSTTGKTAAQAVYIQDRFRRVGVRMEIGTYDFSALRQRIREPNNFDAAIHTYNHIEPFGSFLASGYKNPEISRLQKLIWFTRDQQAADRHLRELWRIFAAEIPVTYLHPTLSYLAAHRRVKGLRNDMEFFSSVEQLSIKDEE